MRYLGIDLAWGENARTGMAELDHEGRLARSASVRTDDEIASFVDEKAQGLVTAIDAPLIVPNQTGQRFCEREVGRLFGSYKAGAYPANRGNPAFNPEPRGARLARRFGWELDPAVRPRPDRSVAIEVYPHPAMVSLFNLSQVIPYKGKKGRDVAYRQVAFHDLFTAMEEVCGPRLDLASSARWQVLRERVEANPRQVDLNTVEDEVDAIFCAYLAWLWTEDAHAMSVIGDVTDGYIVTPPPPPSPASRSTATKAPLAGTSSPTHRLLDELSWEGNARKYRGGGHHLENVLTAEAFSTLDLLPRAWFLGTVMAAATGAAEARAVVISQVESTVVDVLPGDLKPHWLDGTPTGWAIQPDVLFDAPRAFTYVEAKAPQGRFQPAQLARSLLTTLDAAGDRVPLLLLVVGSPPPLPVQGHPRLDLTHALDIGLGSMPETDASWVRSRMSDTVAWVTWSQIADAVQASLTALPELHGTVRTSIERTATRLLQAVDAAQR